MVAAPTTKELSEHPLELARITKLIAGKLSRWYPSSEADEMNAYAARALDALRAKRQALKRLPPLPGTPVGFRRLPEGESAVPGRWYPR
jgi:hypothetical protein